jgi:transcriptional regulator with XRE-family HTH domain
VPSSVGRAIAIARARKGLSIQRLGREAKVDPSLISRLETGKVSDVRLSVASRLCAVLGLKMDELLDGRRRAELPDRPSSSDLDGLKTSLTELLRRVAEMAVSRRR